LIDRGIERNHTQSLWFRVVVVVVIVAVPL